jgi:branched-chain amino acid transport system permease protein
MATIALSIIAADVALWIWGGQIYQFDPPRWIIGSTALPIVGKFATYRLVLLAIAVVIGLALWWFLARTRVGMMIRAGVDDRAMLSASGVNVQMVFAITFAIGAGLAGFAGVVGGTALSIALGAVLIGLAEQFGLAYAPTYGIVFTFVIMALVLAFRPQGILGRRA